jgi:hypothetical protein
MLRFAATVVNWVEAPHRGLTSRTARAPQVIAESYLPLLRNVLEHDLEALAAAALSAMLDLLLVFRDTASWNTPPQSFSASNVSGPFNLVFSCLAHSSPGVRGVAVEGLAKLLTAGRLRGAAVAEGEALTAAALLHFADDADGFGEAAAAQQCLAVFFAGFAGRHPSNAAAVARVVVPTMRHVLNAPAASRLGKVGPTHLGQYLLSLLEQPEPTVAAAASGTALAAAAAADAAYSLAAVELLLEAEACTDDATAARHLAKVLHAIPLVALVGGRQAGGAAVLGLAGRVLAGATDPTTRTALAKFLQAVGDEAAATGSGEVETVSAAAKALPPPRPAEEQEEAVRLALHGPVAGLFLPPGSVIETPARARKASAVGGAAAARRKRAPRAAAAASPASSADGDAHSLRRSTRCAHRRHLTSVPPSGSVSRPSCCLLAPHPLSFISLGLRVLLYHVRVEMIVRCCAHLVWGDSECSRFKAGGGGDHEQTVAAGCRVTRSVRGADAAKMEEAVDRLLEEEGRREEEGEDRGGEDPQDTEDDDE